MTEIVPFYTAIVVTSGRIRAALQRLAKWCFDDFSDGCMTAFAELSDWLFGRRPS